MSKRARYTVSAGALRLPRLKHQELEDLPERALIRPP